MLQRQTLYLTTYLLRVARDRSKALSIELQRLRSQQYPPTGPDCLIDLAIRTNEKITEDLSAMLADQAVVAAIPSREVEINLRAKTTLLAYLHLLMQYVEGAEMQHSPSTMVFPLRRIFRKHFTVRDFDFIVRVSRRYNYSMRPLTEGIQQVFSEAGYLSLLDSFPRLFLVIGCPVSERRNVPIHCIFAHEIGHALYKEHGLADRLLPFVAVRPRLAMITWRWLEELTADALALCLLGPAYLFAYVYFAGPFASLDDSSDEHPPDRMRIKFMCNMLLSKGDGLAYDKVLHETTRDYIEQWKTYVSQPSPTPRAEIRLHSGAAHAIEPVLRKIMIEAKRVTRGRRYTPRRFKRDVPLLCENLTNGIPPNEIMDDWATGQPRSAESEAILNAGWVYLISGDDRYAKLLGILDQWAVTNRLFDLVSKGLEYAEIQRRWKRKR
jgi:hypothetical protein